MEEIDLKLSKMIYKLNLEDIYFSENYELFAKRYKPVLNKPRFSLKKSKIFINKLTYKKINDWDKKRLISGERNDKKAGWRKYSIIDLLKLYIISGLRKIGFSTDYIKKTINRISNYSIELVSKEIIEKEKAHLSQEDIENTKLPFLLLEFFFLNCINGEKFLLIINQDNDVLFFRKEALPTNNFFSNEELSPITILPFYNYVRKIAKVLDIKINYDNDSKVFELIKIMPKEKKILDIINNKEFETITITKKNGKISTVKAKNIHRGSFSDKDVIDSIKQKDYQNVSVSVKDGKKINITREETIKL